MWANTPKLNPTAVSNLLELSSAVPFKDYKEDKHHIGVNGWDKPSIIKSSKWFDWKSYERRFFKSSFPKETVDRSITGWFLSIPPEDGFLDEQTYWENKLTMGVFNSYSLRDNQKVKVGDEYLTFNKGEGIIFSPTIRHAIDPSEEGQLWACLLTI